MVPELSTWCRLAVAMRTESIYYVTTMHKQHKVSAGFTIVELLIVIVVIAILATISIVAYRGIQDRARASEASAGLTQARKKLELYKVDNGTYPTTGNLAAADVKDGDVSYQYTSDGTTYCLTGTVGTISYKASNTDSPSQGGCAGHGQGGVAAITNLATNPSVETGGSSWTPRWYGSGGSGTTTLTSSAAQVGTMGYRKTWTVGGGGQDTGFGYAQAVNAGSTYTFSAFVRASVAIPHWIFIEWYDASNAKINPNTNGANVTVPANTWQRLSLTATAPANAVKAVMVWGPYSTTSVSGQTADFDGVMITEGATLYPYADGGSPNWIWNGPPNGSTSTGPAL